MNALVGYTGFVGGNLYSSRQFEAAYNSKNIGDAFGTRPDLLVYAGIRAEKYLANNAPKKDLELIEEAESNLLKIRPKKVVLISTVDVFQAPDGVDENSYVETQGLSAYGYHRYLLECWVRDHFPDALIVRLPGLFGRGIKKNFIYDYINVVPAVLREEKLLEIVGREPLVKKYYKPFGDGFYQLHSDEKDRKKLERIFQNIGFTAVHFTDHRSMYQFYNLTRLWDDIKAAMGIGIPLLHLVTEPVSAGELYHYLSGDNFVNMLDAGPVSYDCRTAYDGLFGGADGYLLSKGEVLREIKAFVQRRV